MPEDTKSEPAQQREERMAYKVIEIPDGTMYEDSPQITINSVSNNRPDVTIKYKAGERQVNQPQLYGEIRFLDVFEYRWVSFDQYYEAYENDEQGEGFGLIRILDSQWIERMASKGMFQNYPGKRFGPTIDESQVKHYRVSVDDWGVLDVIAMDIAICEFRE